MEVIFKNMHLQDGFVIIQDLESEGPMFYELRSGDSIKISRCGFKKSFYKRGRLVYLKNTNDKIGKTTKRFIFLWNRYINIDITLENN